MVELFIKQVLPLLATLALGAGGWFVTNYFAKDLLEFRRLKAQVHESLFFTANTKARGPDKQRYDAAVDELRRLAAKLDALWASAGWFTKKVWAWRVFDLAEASRCLTGYSNSLESTDGSRAVFRHAAEKALKLPLTDSVETLKRIVDRLYERS